MTSIVVAVRVRPFNARELKYGSRCVVGMPQPGVCTLQEVRQGKVIDGVAPRRHSFDHAFWTHDPSEGAVTFASQAYVYEQLGASVLRNALLGFNGCLFAYGQTGSGKTYTMMGTPSDPGVIPRLCRDLFAEAASCDPSSSQISIECSYLEIYNENVRDLLSPKSYEKSVATGLKVRQHPTAGVYVEGLTKLSVTSEAEILKLIDDGGKLRAVASTNMNATSSRSHAILTLVIRNKRATGELRSSLNLVDLAGSERASATGAEGDTLLEGANINKSLTTLGMCLSRLAEASSSGEQGGNKGHVPFRDSQLTWILNDSLGGNSKTAMLANISPASINYEETLSTLRFAMTVKKIKNNAVINEDPQQKLIRELRQEIEDIKQQISLMEERVAAGIPSSAPTGGGIDASSTVESKKMTLLDRLTENTILMAEASETDEERDNRMKLLKITHERAMREVLLAQNTQRTQSQTMPRLHTLNEDLHALSSIALIYYLREGTTVAGSAPAQSEQDEDLLPTIRLPTSWHKEVFHPRHAVFYVDGLSETVWVESVAQDRSSVAASSSSIRTSAAELLAEDDADASVNLSAGGGDEGRTSDSLRRSSVTMRPAQVCVNGVPVPPGQKAKVDHRSRVMLGLIAFRLSHPPSWGRNRCEFSSAVVQNRRHCELLEEHARRRMEAEYLVDLSECLNTLFPSSPPSVAEEEGEEACDLGDEYANQLKSDVDGVLSETNCLLGHVETQLVEEFPLGPSEQPATLAVEHSLVSEYDEAVRERELQKQKTSEAVRSKRSYLDKLQMQRTENNSEIAALKMQIETQDARRQMEEQQRRANAQLREAGERKPIPPQTPKSPAPEQVEAGGAPSTPKPTTPKPTPIFVDPATPSPAPVDTKTAKANSTSKKQLLLRRSSGQDNAEMIALNALRHELQRYDEECRVARQWKPEGPTKEEDRSEYLASQSEIPLAEVLRLGRPVLTTVCHKYRVKHGLFRRTGFHKVFLVVRERFLYYFDSDEPKAKSLGAAYVFGADVLQLHEVLDGKKFLLRVVPSVPRKPSKSEMGATEENNLLLGFDTEKQMSELLHVLLQLSVPKCPESVAEHLKRESCKDATE